MIRTCASSGQNYAGGGGAVGEMLVRLGYVTPADVEAALTAQRGDEPGEKRIEPRRYEATKRVIAASRPPLSPRFLPS